MPPGVDASRPSPARLYDYYLGGSHNLAVDRELGDRFRAAVPDLEDGVWANRAFHQRAAPGWPTRPGIRQFIDIGSGLPTRDNTHDVVHKVAPEARVVYVDHDPMVAAYASELLAGDGTTAVVTADLRDPDALLNDPAVGELIDFTEPVGLLMTAVLHFVADGSDPWGLVTRYVAAVVPGSYLALSHFTADKLPPRASRRARTPTRRPRRASTRGRWPRSSGSSPGWTWCRRSRAPTPGSATWACGGPRIRWPRTAMARAACTAAWPASADVEQA